MTGVSFSAGIMQTLGIKYNTVLGGYLKLTCSRVTSACSALGGLNDYALYKSTHSLTHSLTQYCLLQISVIMFTYTRNLASHVV